MAAYSIPTNLVYPPEFKSIVTSAIELRYNSFLAEGEPGTGKTSLGLAWGKQAELRGGWSIFAQANAWIDDTTLVRGVDLAGFVERNPARVYAAGIMLRVLELVAAHPGRDGVVVLDEWDKTRPNADGLLLAALQERVVVDSTGHVWGKLPENVLFYITSNAMRDLHPALRRRVFCLKFPPMAGEALIARLWRRGVGGNTAKLLAVMADECRAAGQPLTLTDVERIGEIAQRLDGVRACKMLMSAYPAARTNPGGDLWAALCRDRRRAG